MIASTPSTSPASITARAPSPSSSLGNFAIAYGYQKFDQTVTWTAVIIMIVLVQVVQAIANAIAKRLRRSALRARR